MAKPVSPVRPRIAPFVTVSPDAAATELKWEYRLHSPKPWSMITVLP